ncbi:helix-turn-helix transcriptional regulator [Desulfofundulus sp. TPOSR]|uniref:helix-turn-helix domain-containing protein n=1 Tax=Desulfofundulus sp. TPOSR TaxID=2714340 RepID=UPI001409B22B|nr:helix-turn-helix transcriptional regulator [Desulfofundulus sp. TPOSR]
MYSCYDPHPGGPSGSPKPGLFKPPVQTAHGQSFIDYLTQVRLNEAKALLLAGEKTIDQIASAVGFNNNSYFTAVFKKREGVTPSEFRQRRRGDGSRV